jgi:hypothetical protein
MPEGKRKLTLTVDSETVDAAKKLGLNISDLTEQLLRGYTFDPKVVEAGLGEEEYKRLCATMDTLLRKYDCAVHIGALRPYEPDAHEGEGLSLVYYHGAEVVDTSDSPITDINTSETFETIGRDDYYIDFLRPDQILKNFLRAIARAQESRQEQAEGFAVAMGVISLLTDAESKRSSRSNRDESSGGKP